jgi:selenocysteine lyase/cysteine desulfurase
VHPEFDLSPDLCYLNHAGIAPWPKRTVEAVTAFARENATRGARDYPTWIETETRLRERLATLIHAQSPMDIALTKSTSESLSMIAHGLDWRRGDNVVGIRQEFPSNRIVWESLADQGVEYRQLDLDQSEELELDLNALADENTRLVAVSSVQYGRGRRLDLERIGACCRGRGILLCIDAIQSLGALPFDLQRIQADFVAADGHKWMLGPEGLALLYVNPRLRPRLRLHEYGWHMVADRGDFDRKGWTPAADATRFECGSPNMLGIYALEASLSLLLEVGMESVHAAIEERITRLVELIDGKGFELLSPREPERRAGIVTFRVPGTEPQLLYRDLMKHQVVCAQRGGGIRFSPHFYTDEALLERAIATAASHTQGRHAR